MRYSHIIYDNLKCNIIYRELQDRFPKTQKDRDFYFFVLDVSDSYDLFDELRHVLLFSYNMNVKNTVIMSIPRYTDYISFYALQIFEPTACRDDVYRNAHHEINRYVNGKLQHDFLFPPQIQDFYNCPIKISVNLLDPLITFDGDLANEEHLHEASRIGGIEGDILTLLAETLNISLVFHFPSHMAYNSNDTWHLNDIFGDVSTNILCIF